MACGCGCGGQTGAIDAGDLMDGTIAAPIVAAPCAPVKRFPMLLLLLAAVIIGLLMSKK